MLTSLEFTAGFTGREGVGRVLFVWFFGLLIFTRIWLGVLAVFLGLGFLGVSFLGRGVGFTLGGLGGVTLGGCTIGFTGGRGGVTWLCRVADG